MRVAGGAVRTWHRRVFETEGDPCVFPRMPHCATPPDQPQIQSYWDAQAWEQAQQRMERSGHLPLSSMPKSNPTKLRPPQLHPKLQTHSISPQMSLMSLMSLHSPFSQTG